MKYEELKNELAQIVNEHYQNGTPVLDIRAAIHAVDLMAENYSAIELVEISKSMHTDK